MFDSVLVHSLALASICDGCTTRVMGGSVLPSSFPTIGLLFGIYENSGNGSQSNSSETGKRIVSIRDSYEIVYVMKTSSDHVSSSTIFTIDDSEISRRKRLIAAVFPQYELVGWYTAAKLPSAEHIRMQESIAQHCKDPILVCVDTNANPGEIPITAYEFVRNLQQQESGFVQVPFSMASTDSERLCIDSVTKNIAGKGSSAIESQLSSMCTSIEILEKELNTITEALQKMQKGEIPLNRELLRRASKAHALLNRSRETKDSIETLNFETSLISMLSLATKSLSDIRELSDVVTNTGARKQSI